MATEDNKKRPEVNEIATTRDGRDITRGFTEGLPFLRSSDPILRQQGGLAAYEDLLRDDQVAACFSQRRNAVLARPWTVTPGGPRRIDKQAAQLVEQTLNTLQWDDITDKMLFARFFGYSVSEIMWKPANGQVIVYDIRTRHPRRFVFSPDNELKLLTFGNPNGETLPARKFWIASIGAFHDDEPHGIGLGQALWWPVWFKRNGARFWATMLEKFGMPTVVGEFPSGTPKSEQDKLLNAVQAVVSDSGLIMPAGLNIRLMEATRGGNAGYSEWMGYWDAAIAKVILGQTMTTDDGSSYAQATVHYDVRQDLVKADADLISQTANGSWVQWLVDYNLPGAAYPQIWRDLEDAEDLKARAERDQILFGLGFKLTPAAVQKIYGDDYEPITPPAPVAPTDAPPPEPQDKPIGFRLPAFAEPVKLAEEDNYLSPPSIMADTLSSEADAAWREIMSHIERLVATAPSLPALRDALLSAYAELPIEQLGNVMATAFAAAELAGRYDAREDAING